MGVGDSFSELQAAECRAKTQCVGLFGTLIGYFEVECGFNDIKKIEITGLKACDDGEVYIIPNTLKQIEVAKSGQKQIQNVRIGQICLVEKSAGKLVRARILSVENEMTAFLIDFGIKVIVKHCYEIDKESCAQCAGAVRCKLAFLETDFGSRESRLNAFVEEVD